MDTHIIKAGEFKTHCLELMETVKKEHVEFIITKRGVPIAKLVPVGEHTIPAFGFMKDSVLYMGDLLAPLDVSWDANDE